MNYECMNGRDAGFILNVCTKTLQEWDKAGKISTIRTSGGRRRYNVKKYIEDNNIDINLGTNVRGSLNRRKVVYCRVSSYDRKDDLVRQVELLKSSYPDHEVIEDIGSGINFKRKGLQKIIQYAIANELEEVVITYKDRLCRIGYDLIEFIIHKYSNGKIIITNSNDESREIEITKDLIEIITVYSSKIHGTRRNFLHNST